MTVEWMDPPAARVGRPPWMIPDAVQAELKANPRRTARVAQGVNRKFIDRARKRHPGFELTHRKTSRGTSRDTARYDVFAKWVG